MAALSTGRAVPARRARAARRGGSPAAAPQSRAAAVAAPKAVSTGKLLEKLQLAAQEVAESLEQAPTRSYRGSDYHGPVYHAHQGNGTRRHSTGEWRRYLESRAATVEAQFPGALGQDDFMFRTELALSQFGFNSDNTIALTNMCRDEIVAPLKLRIDEVFGYSFSSDGLGGVISCGVTGFGAGMSHSPIEGGKERYVFFAFPHIAIDSAGVQGAISRPFRPGMSCACGALAAARGLICEHGPKKLLDPATRLIDPFLDPELALLMNRLATYLDSTGQDTSSMDLVAVTKAAEAAIRKDLEMLIGKAVDPQKADYAVITGVQIHNWGTDFEDDEPNMEFVCPVASYAVVDGKRTDFDLQGVSPPTPRQLAVLAGPTSDAARKVGTPGH